MSRWIQNPWYNAVLNQLMLLAANGLRFLDSHPQGKRSPGRPRSKRVAAGTIASIGRDIDKSEGVSTP